MNARFRSLEEMLVSAAEAVRPPERLTVPEAAEKYRWLNNPGSYVGPYRVSVTPYLKEPMEVLTSLDFTGMAFVGPAQAAKPLALDTPIATPTGWTTMGEVEVGDLVFAADGSQTAVIAKSPVKIAHDAYRITFEDGEQIVCDGEHPWPVCDMWSGDPVCARRLPTHRIAESYLARSRRGGGFRYSVWDIRPRTNPRFIRAVERAEPTLVQCLTVAHPAHLFLVGRTMIPTCNSEMALSWLAYSVICDPADFMHIDKSQAAARDFYQRRVEKMLRDTPAVRARLLPGTHHQSTYSTKFTSGMLYTLSWPTVNELSGKPVGRLWLADYDRMDEDVGGEGSPYDLAVQRAKSFRRFGMTVAESSPSRSIENRKWIAKTPHEAPPTTGILSLYNRGDRRRWHWRCVSCGNGFEPDFSLLAWPNSDDAMEAAEQVYMSCPHCGQVYHEGADPTRGIPGKHALNLAGRWVKDGQRIDPDTGEVVGEGVRSRMASFWLKGPAAAFASWSDMVLKYLKAVQEFEATGSEEALKTTVNTDQALPYLPRAAEQERLPEELKARASDLGERVVPEGVRFLVTSVDVQRSRFEVQVHGIGANGDVWIIDRYNIKKSERRDEDGERKPLDPASYVEDWHLLVERALLDSYPLADGSGRKMRVRMMCVDTGGREGVTANAYEWWRQLRKDGRSLDRRVTLLKGEPLPSAPLTRIDYPDAERKDRRAQARGEVPVLFVQTNKAKDMVHNMLGRTEPGGTIYFPAWLPDWWFTELVAETRTAKGWVNPGKQRNEAWDLLVYAVALCQSSRIGLAQIDWSRPPSWADVWDKNDFVLGPNSNFGFASQPKSDNTLANLADRLA